MTFLYKWLARQIPGLDLKLKEARMSDTDESYMKKTWQGSMFLSLGLTLVFFLFTKKLLIFLVFPIMFLFMFSYLARGVDVKISKMKREIDKEILFAGKFIIIELESGVPLYTTFKNVVLNYETIGPYFNELVDKVDLGTDMEDALNEVIAATPSPNLRKVLWQILNSFKTGSNITGSLSIVLDQIGREQQIIIKEYGKKLNPIAMFYMMAAIIVPSLGITMLAVLASFIGWKISLGVLLVLVVVLAFVQFMFLAVIKSSRPPMAV
ncbi:MAG: type II secretion system F family protein [Nanoarchaeota archaeon]|nr:type II secretion system F family protein [Nanoarchaeota archaeon]MBU1855298.1 type II secretion system F family protein [Nanoarchaeota archaeon]